MAERFRRKSAAIGFNKRKENKIMEAVVFYSLVFAGFFVIAAVVEFFQKRFIIW